MFIVCYAYNALLLSCEHVHNIISQHFPLQTSDLFFVQTNHILLVFGSYSHRITRYIAEALYFVTFSRLILFGLYFWLLLLLLLFVLLFEAAIAYKHPVRTAHLLEKVYLNKQY